MENILLKAQDLMLKSVEFLKRDLASVSTGRAHPDLLSTIKVESYGSIMKLNQLANITVTDSSTLLVQVWDKSMVTPVEKAISSANLGFNPKVEGQTLRISIPRLTEERRKELCKVVKKYAEDAKISVRNVRKDLINEVKKQKTAYSEDEIKATNDKIQNVTDQHIKKIEDLLTAKEKDILSI